MGEFEFGRVSRKVKSNPLLINVVLALLSLSNLLNMLAFTTTAWGRVYSISGGGFFGFGLWRICSSGTQSFTVGSLCTDTTGWPQDWYGASQTFAIFGFLGIVGGLILLLLFLCLKQCKGNTSFLFGTGIYILVTGIIYSIGIIIFGAKFDTLYGTFTSGFGSLASLSWSFALAIVANVFALVSGALLVVQARHGRSTSPPKDKHSKSTSKHHSSQRRASNKDKSGDKTTGDKTATKNKTMTSTKSENSGIPQNNEPTVEMSSAPASTAASNV